MMSTMARYISYNHQYCVPMNANFGLVDEIVAKKFERKQHYHDRSMAALENYLEENK